MLHKEQTNNGSFKKGRKAWNKGLKGYHKGHKPYIQAKGKDNPFYGKKHRIDSKEKMRLAKIGNWAKDKHPNWQGGKSFEKYSVDWTNTLKRAIKERDKYVCQICNSLEDLIVHHRDKNKLNCNPDNLITLCRSCHIKLHRGKEGRII
jgi:hypothetical protein